MKISSLTAMLLITAALPFAGAARPLTAEDLAGFNRITDAALSPDGQTVVFSMEESDLKANKRRTDLFLIDLNQAQPVPERLFPNPEMDALPTWSSDGDTLYFLSVRGEPARPDPALQDGGSPKTDTKADEPAAQVWKSVRGGPPEQVTYVQEGISGFTLSPGGETLYWWTDEGAPEPRFGSGHVYDHLPVRYWDHWLDGSRTEVYAQPLSGGDARLLTKDIPGELSDGKPVMAPDGKTLAFSVGPAKASETASFESDVWLLDTQTGAAKNLTPEGSGYDGAPAISPNGRTIAWLSNSEPLAEADFNSVVLYDLASGTARKVGPDWDLSVGSLKWAPDGALLIGVQEEWNTNLYRWKPGEGAPTRIDLPDGNITLVEAAEHGLLLSEDSLVQPADLYLWKDGRQRQLTAVNAERLIGIDMSTPHRFDFAGAGGANVHGYVVEPYGLKGGEVAKTVLWSHGGPHGQWSNSFSYRWNPLVWAGAGFAVVAVDFQGSSGYGHDFVNRVKGDWGGKPFRDLQLGLAAARQQFDFLNDDRACAAGGSYGGYMMNWIEGAWPDEFACIVNHDGLFDLRSFVYSWDDVYGFDNQFGGKAYLADPAAYEKWNPINFVDKWKTPMLVVHGQQDYRVPVEQGLAAFSVLQRKGIDSRLLVFEDENHWVLKPGNSVQWHTEVFRWLNKYLGSEAANSGVGPSSH